ncbi:hypothetical protein HPB50_015631 [Hyalomma asiaticum]|uniref:Uncharacterized protein n=1 Tax=Hyalomma asiaticum TaxID=266040 RepID=A0ACB7SHU8_HYAAI|nr:hypothetical protein HPB50_015631 [Hyalomma asiaticum]
MSAASGGPRASRIYDVGSLRDSFAINEKAVVAARSVGMGYEQLVRFLGIVGLPKPTHHKSSAAISQKVHAAMVAISENLSKPGQLTQSEVGGNDIAVMYDGTWQKRGHKSYSAIYTVVSLDTGLCQDFKVLSRFSSRLQSAQSLAR